MGELIDDNNNPEQSGGPENGADPYLVVRPMGEKRQRKLAVRSAGRRRLRSSAVFMVVGVALFASFKLGYANYQPRRSRPVAAAARNARPKVEAPVFARAAEMDLSLRLPAPKSEVIAIGYHQAYNPRSLQLISETDLVPDASRESISRILGAGPPPAFQMDSRGRSSGPASSVDVAVKADTLIKSPVTGKIEAVRPYLLYGRYDDVQIDISPEGHPDVSVAIVHLDRPVVSVGQTVIAGETPLAFPRKLVINSQIDQYLGQITEHIHMQVNPRVPAEVVANEN